MTIKNDFGTSFIISRVVVRMKLYGIILVALWSQAVGESFKKDDDVNLACIIRFLQIMGKLEENITAQSAPGNICRILLPLIFANHSERLCIKLWETKSINAKCVFENLKQSNFIDLELKQKIFSEAPGMRKSFRNKKLFELQSIQKGILINTAKLCKSDPIYGGIFDKILGINSSLILMQENYCMLKYVTENKFLVVSKINLNPKNIPTWSIECRAIVIKKQNENEQKFIEAFHNLEFSSDTIQCLLKLYHDDKIFGWNLAKDLLYRIEINDKVRLAEDYRISKTLSDFSGMSKNCVVSFNWGLFNY